MPNIEVAYATPEKQKIIALQVAEGCTAFDAAVQSGIDTIFPQIQFESDPMGIFGNNLGSRGLPPAKEYVMREGDRVEIYRPLIADPKEARRQRAAKASSD